MVSLTATLVGTNAIQQHMHKVYIYIFIKHFHKSHFYSRVPIFLRFPTNGTCGLPDMHVAKLPMKR